MTDTNPLIESIVAEYDRRFIADDGLYYYVANDIEGTTTKDFLRDKLTHIRTLSIAEGEKIGREKAVEYIRKELEGKTSLRIDDILEQASRPSYEE